MTTERLRAVLLGALSVVAGVTGCGDADEPAGAAESAIFGGDTVGGDGSVELIIYAPNGSSATCTGVVVARRLMLTAAHCFGPSLGSAMMGTVNVDVNYTADGTNWKCATQSQSGGKCKKRINTWVRRLSSADPNGSATENDIAVVYRSNQTGGQAWLNMTSSDYQLLDTRVPALNAPITVHGVGRNTRTGGTGTMRSADFPLQGSNATSVFVFGNNRNAICAGDSGGPWYAFIDDFAVVGLTHFGAGSTMDCVASSDILEVAHRITTSDIQLINTELSFVDPGQSCSKQGSVYRCF